MLNKRFSLLALCLLSTFLLKAQDYLSPFSQYGIGDRQSPVLSRYQAMGGACAAAIDDNTYSLVNPASYALVHSFVFEGATYGTLYHLKTNSQQYSYSDAGVPYVSFAVPSTLTKRNWGFSAGLLPFSRVGYRVESDNPSPIRNVQLIEATGGSSRFYIGTGFQLFKNCFIGGNVSYVFGRIDYSHKLIFPDSTDENGAEQTTRTNISDFIIDGGLIYRIKLKHDKNIQIGVSAILPKNMHTVNTVSFNLLSTNTQNFIFADSIIRGNREDLYTYQPLDINGGLNFNYSDTLHIFANVHYTQWSHLSNAQDVMGFNIGGEWMPGAGVSSGKLASYLGRVHYRIGAGYSKGFINPDLIIPDDRHVSIGVGLPTSKYLSSESRGSFVNIALQWGQTGNLKTTGARMNYLMLTLGIHLYEPDWFRQQKIE